MNFKSRKGGWTSYTIILLFFLIVFMSLGTESMPDGQKCVNTFTEYTEQNFGGNIGVGAVASFVWNTIINSFFTQAGGIITIGLITFTGFNAIIVAVFMFSVLVNFFLIPFSCIIEVLASFPPVLFFPVLGAFLFLLVFTLVSSIQNREQ